MPENNVYFTKFLESIHSCENLVTTHREEEESGEEQKEDKEGEEEEKEEEGEENKKEEGPLSFIIYPLFSSLS